MEYNYGLKLKCFRKAACLSQEAAAELVGISANTMSSYENGESTIPLSVFIKLADLYNFDVYDILRVHEPSGEIIYDATEDELKRAHQMYMDRTFY